MDEREKTFLMSIIALDKKLKANDKSVAAEIAFLKEYNQTTPGNQSQVYDLVVKAIEKTDGTNKDLLHYAVSELNLRNKEYLQHLINMPSHENTYELKLYLENIFSVDIPVDDNYIKFGFYNKVVFLALQLGDPILIEKAVNKIQEL